MTNQELSQLWKRIKVLQKKGGVLVLLAFNVLAKDRLRRNELATALGAKISEGAGGLLSDKTLDERLADLTSRGFLKSEKDHSLYPPAKYYKLTEKGKTTSNTLRMLIEELH